MEDSIKHTEDIYTKLFFELDRSRVTELRGIFETALELCTEVRFEERERLCYLLENNCEERLHQIEESPTKLSIEVIYSIIKIIQEKVKDYRTELYETSKPQLALRVPVESYAPDTDRNIRVQIVVGEWCRVKSCRLVGVSYSGRQYAFQSHRTKY